LPYIGDVDEANLSRSDGTDALVPLQEALADARDPNSQLLYRGLELVLGGVPMKQGVEADHASPPVSQLGIDEAVFRKKLWYVSGLGYRPESLVGHHVIAQIVDQFDAQLEEAFGAAVSFRFGNEIVAGVSSELFQDCLMFGQTLEPSLNELTINIQGPASVGGVSNAQQRFQIAVLAEVAGEVVPVGETGAV
jgi:hypothetical protein